MPASGARRGFAASCSTPRYAGIKTHLGKPVERETDDGERERVRGNWTPLIDEETYERVKAELSDKSRQKVTSFERKYVGSGVDVCGKCGGTM